MTKPRTWILLLSMGLLASSLAGCADDGASTTEPEIPEETPEATPDAPQEPVDAQTAPVEEIPMDTATTWYLHHTGGCSGADGEVETLDRSNSTGDDDGCGGIGPGYAMGAAMFNYTATEASPAYSTGTPVTATLHMMFSHPGYTEVQVVLLQNGTEVGVSVWAGVILMPLVYVELPFEFSTEGQIPAGAALGLEIRPYAVESAFMGYEEDHTSLFTLG